jgi:bacillithiol biosynthesis deacetylase BshB1
MQPVGKHHGFTLFHLSTASMTNDANPRSQTDIQTTRAVPVSSMLLNPPLLDILVVAPHPDDAELGCGGAIGLWRDEGLRVGVLDLTDGEPTPFGSVETRCLETEAATRILDLTWRGNLGLANRALEGTLEARGLLAGVFRLARPRWILAPYWEDAHPDHVAATSLIEAARFWSKLTKTELPGDPFHPQRIYYYYCIHLRTIPHPAFILDISQQWERKLAAIRAFESQFIIGRPTDAPTFIDRVRDEAAYWGKLIGRSYGEPLTSREPIALSSMRDMF